MLFNYVDALFHVNKMFFNNTFGLIYSKTTCSEKYVNPYQTWNIFKLLNSVFKSYNMNTEFFLFFFQQNMLLKMSPIKKNLEYF